MNVDRWELQFMCRKCIFGNCNEILKFNKIHEELKKKQVLVVTIIKKTAHIYFIKILDIIGVKSNTSIFKYKYYQLFLSMVTIEHIFLSNKVDYLCSFLLSILLCLCNVLGPQTNSISI